MDYILYHGMVSFIVDDKAVIEEIDYHRLPMPLSGRSTKSNP